MASAVIAPIVFRRCRSAASIWLKTSASEPVGTSTAIEEASAAPPSAAGDGGGDGRCRLGRALRTGVRRALYGALLARVLVAGHPVGVATRATVPLGDPVH